MNNYVPPTFVLSQDDEVHLTRVDTKDMSNLPKAGKFSVIVYHRRSRKFFAGTTSNPSKYFPRLIHNIATGDPATPGAIAVLAKTGSEFDFAFCHIKARGQIEYALINKGYSRCHTRVGSMVENVRMIFEVHSPIYKVTRYISCDASLEIKDIAAKANKALIDWITRDCAEHIGVRLQMRHDFENVLKGDRAFFTLGTSIISPCRGSDTIMLKYQRREVERLNNVFIESYFKNREII